MPLYDRGRFSIDSNDQYCRYLDIKLPLYPSRSLSSGRFGQLLKDFGIIFPFKITIFDLVFSKIFKPSLYVELPKSYFDSWDNFPLLSSNFTDPHDPDASWYNIRIIPSKSNDLHDYLHPYDWELKETFVKKFQSDLVEKPIEHQHKNGSKFIAGEAYLPFWILYALANSYYRYRHAALIIIGNDAKERVLGIIKQDVSRFSDKYAQIFERNSWFKTMLTIAYYSKNEFDYLKLFEFSKNYSNVDQNILKDDLKKLMCLYTEWSGQIKKHGCSVLTNACRHLTLDIYYIFEQLRLLGCSEDELFDEFSYPNRNINIMPLYEILNYEKILFRQTFISFGKHYCSEIAILQPEFINSVYERLYEIKGFDAWIRAFNDIHKNLNNGKKSKATFDQFRIIDSLIVIAIRTEIVIREMFRPIMGDEKSNATMKVLLKNIYEHIDDFGQYILSQVRNGEIYKITELHDMPTQIFKQIEEIKKYNLWKNEQFYYFKAFVKFITARNYFAHHAYKDSEINEPLSSLAAEIIKACIVTLLFINKHKTID